MNIETLVMGRIPDHVSVAGRLDFRITAFRYIRRLQAAVWIPAARARLPFCLPPDLADLVMEYLQPLPTSAAPPPDPAILDWWNS
jgi:hypothetical protein